MKATRDGQVVIEKLSQLRTTTENLSLLACAYTFAPFVTIFVGLWQSVLAALLVALALLVTMYRGRLERNRYFWAIPLAWCGLTLFGVVALILLLFGAF